ncbi:MAG: NAD-dependent deacylase [Desulfobulbaceae bacterium]|jgi:NAD-dependent deacetylase|nr:NAD-dependent deacylase [Desulfobulbaceae bacterium]
MKTIRPGDDGAFLREAAKKFRQAKQAVALTGAGISVASGIPDFRSPGGLWSMYAPQEYCALDAFYANPEKTWKLFRELGASLFDKKPSAAHRTLAELETAKLLRGIVTQNIDCLHQAAGSSQVLEIHGDHFHLQCLSCGYLGAAKAADFHGSMPRCPHCGQALKPNIVLFGETVRALDAIQSLIAACDLLLVIGTSAKVYPAAALPTIVRQQGGLIYEFNLEPALSTISEYCFQGDLTDTMSRFGQAALEAA